MIQGFEVKFRVPETRSTNRVVHVTKPFCFWINADDPDSLCISYRQAQADDAGRRWWSRAIGGTRLDSPIVEGRLVAVPVDRRAICSRYAKCAPCDTRTTGATVLSARHPSCLPEPGACRRLLA